MGRHTLVASSLSSHDPLFASSEGALSEECQALDGSIMQEGPEYPLDSIPAAQYVRMSTDHHEDSIDNQIRAIAGYAQRHNVKIVRTYSDAGRSGLSTSGRNGILDLLKDIKSGLANYRVVLVYDVSRWGRFQDTDE